MGWRERCPYLVESAIIAIMLLVVAIVVLTL
jgi:hypothetical protein